MKYGLLWNTYRGDLDWFKISVRSWQKYARGFDRVLCIVPEQDLALFHPITGGTGIELCPIAEWPGKGFNWHQLQTCYSDQHFPGVDVIFHIDADCVFANMVDKQKIGPECWISGDGRILMPFTPYSAFIKHPVREDEMHTFMGFTGKKIDFDRGQLNWKFAVDFALGIDSQRECMAWMPMVHHRDVYKKTREIIAARFPDQGFDNYVFNARNEHPQSFCEFNTLGAVAHAHFPDRYHWWDLEAHQAYPFYGAVIQSWSGEKRKPFAEQIERPHDYGKQVPHAGINSPRKLFQHLGLL